MFIIFILVFLGAFAFVALVLTASGTGASAQTKKVIAALNSALATNRTASGDEMVDLRKNELLSAVPWVNRVLANIKLAPRLRTMLYQANVKWTAGGLLLMMGGFFMIPGYAVYLYSGKLLMGLIAGCFAGFAPFGYVLHRRKARFALFEKGLPEALELMVSALKVGHSLNAALSLVVRECPDPIAGEFRICYDEQNFGLEMRTAMDNLVARVPLQDLKIVTTAILIQKESGGNLAEVLDKTGQVIRERFRLKRQVMTHTAQGRLTGYILSALPVVLGVALYFVNPETMSLLWKRDIGVKLLYASAGMTFVGSMIIRKIVSMDV